MLLLSVVNTTIALTEVAAQAVALYAFHGGLNSSGWVRVRLIARACEVVDSEPIQ